MTYKVQELGARGRVSLENPAHGGRDHCAARLLDAANYHAEVLRFDDYASAPGLEFFDQGVRYLAGQAFLQLGPPGKALDYPCQLGQADYAPGWDVANVRFAYKW